MPITTAKGSEVDALVVGAGFAGLYQLLTPMLDRIERDIHFAGPLTEEQRSKLLEIANKCPVHRTLTSEIDIVTRAV